MAYHDAYICLAHTQTNTHTIDGMGSWRYLKDWSVLEYESDTASSRAEQEDNNNRMKI